MTTTPAVSGPNLRGLLQLVATESTLALAVADAGAARLPALDLTAPPALRPFVIAALVDRADKAVLAVTATSREAEDLVDSLRCLLAPDSIALFPAWETLPHERLSPRSDTVGRRLAVLRRLVHPDEPGMPDGPIKVVVAPVRSVLQPQVRGLADLEPVSLQVGAAVDLDDVVRRLADAAYHRVDLVERRGEFAVRGGIIDVFPPTEEHPLRVDFFGDEVEEIRGFSVADQRSLEDATGGLWAPPCRELLLTDEVRRRARALAEAQPELAEMLDRIAEGHAVEGMEALAPVLVDEMELLVDLLPECAGVVVCDPERVRTRSHDLVATSQEFLQASWAAAAGGGTAPIDLGAAAYRSLADVREHAMGLGHSWWSVSPFGLDPDAGPHSGSPDLRDITGAVVRTDVDVSVGSVESRSVDVRAADSYRADTEAAITDIRDWLRAGRRVVLVTQGHGSGQRMVELLAEHDIAARFDDELDRPPGADVVHVTCGTLEHGFVAPGVGLAVLTGDDIAGQRASTKDMRQMPVRRKRQIDPIELRTGDFVVHDQHGVGRYVEMAQRTVAAATREYLVLEYAASKRAQPADRLYVPTDQLDQVTRYVGGEQPSLDRLGGGDWARRKGRARRAVKQIAAELIKLYAARQATQGHAFGPDSPWQRELEDAFGFVETPDQLSTVEEVKADMEQPVPMDRLVCGDVGYGKTEIAVRAAFKAVQDGKQVADLGADDAAGLPALLDVRRAVRGLPGQRPCALPVPDRHRGRGRGRGAARRHRRRRRRHPPTAEPRGQVQGPRPDRRRRGAALRRRAQGADEAAAYGGRRAEHVRDPDPAHAGDGDHRHPRDVHDHHTTGGAAPRADLRRRLRPRRR